MPTTTYDLAPPRAEPAWVAPPISGLPTPQRTPRWSTLFIARTSAIVTMLARAGAAQLLEWPRLVRDDPNL